MRRTEGDGWSRGGAAGAARRTGSRPLACPLRSGVYVCMRFRAQERATARVRKRVSEQERERERERERRVLASCAVEVPSKQQRADAHLHAWDTCMQARSPWHGRACDAAWIAGRRRRGRHQQPRCVPCHLFALCFDTRGWVRWRALMHRLDSRLLPHCLLHHGLVRRSGLPT